MALHTYNSLIRILASSETATTTTAGPSEDSPATISAEEDQIPPEATLASVSTSEGTEAQPDLEPGPSGLIIACDSSRGQAVSGFNGGSTNSGADRSPSNSGLNRGPSNSGLNQGPSNSRSSRRPTNLGPSRVAFDSASIRGPTHSGSNRGSAHSGASRGPAHSRSNLGLPDSAEAENSQGAMEPGTSQRAVRPTSMHFDETTGSKSRFNGGRILKRNPMLLQSQSCTQLYDIGSQSRRPVILLKSPFALCDQCNEPYLPGINNNYRIPTAKLNAVLPPSMMY